MPLRVRTVQPPRHPRQAPRERLRFHRAVVERDRGREPVLAHGLQQGAPPGDVNLEQVEGGLADHARVACDLVEQAQNRNINPERIAILYPARGLLLDAVHSELTRRELDFRHEGDDKLPDGSLSRFIQRCASRAVTNYQIHTAPPRPPC